MGCRARSDSHPYPAYLFNLVYPHSESLFINAITIRGTGSPKNLCKKHRADFLENVIVYCHISQQQGLVHILKYNNFVGLKKPTK